MPSQAPARADEPRTCARRPRRCCAPTASARRSSRTWACGACACCRRPSSAGISAFDLESRRVHRRRPADRSRGRDHAIFTPCAKPPKSAPAGAAAVRVAVVAARFNAAIVEHWSRARARPGARRAAMPRALRSMRVPGAFELPLAAQALARRGQFDAHRRAGLRDPRRYARTSISSPVSARAALQQVMLRHRRAGRLRRADDRESRPRRRSARAGRAQQGRARRCRRRSRWRSCCAASGARMRRA